NAEGVGGSLSQPCMSPWFECSSDETARPSQGKPLLTAGSSRQGSNDRDRTEFGREALAAGAVVASPCRRSPSRGGRQFRQFRVWQKSMIPQATLWVPRGERPSPLRVLVPLFYEPAASPTFGSS